MDQEVLAGSSGQERPIVSLLDRQIFDVMNDTLNTVTSKQGSPNYYEDISSNESSEVPTVKKKPKRKNKKKRSSSVSSAGSVSKKKKRKRRKKRSSSASSASSVRSSASSSSIPRKKKRQHCRYLKRVNAGELKYDFHPHKLIFEKPPGKKFKHKRLPNKACRVLKSHCAKRFPTAKDKEPQHVRIRLSRIK